MQIAISAVPCHEARSAEFARLLSNPTPRAGLGCSVELSVLQAFK